MVSGQVIGEVGEQLADLGVEGVLDAVETWHAAQRDLEARVFAAAALFADLHHPDSRPGSGGRVLPGSERGIRLGGVGTPKVLEFAPAEFAARIGKSPYSGQALIADALDTRHRLPRLWARVAAGEVAVHFARHVAQATRDLSVGGAGLVDAGVVEYADGRISWARFQNLVAAKVIEADPQAAAERERAASEEEFVKVGRTNEHGQKTMYVKSTGAAIIRVLATLRYLADVLAALGDTDSLDKRLAKALLILANPAQAVQLLLAFASYRADQANTAAVQDTFDDLDHPLLGGAQPMAQRPAANREHCSAFPQPQHRPCPPLAGAVPWPSPLFCCSRPSPHPGLVRRGGGPSRHRARCRSPPRRSCRSAADANLDRVQIRCARARAARS